MRGKRVQKPVAFLERGKLCSNVGEQVRLHCLKLGNQFRAAVDHLKNIVYVAAFLIVALAPVGKCLQLTDPPRKMTRSRKGSSLRATRRMFSFAIS